MIFIFLRRDPQVGHSRYSEATSSSGNLVVLKIKYKLLMFQPCLVLFCLGATTCCTQGPLLTVLRVLKIKLTSLHARPVRSLMYYILPQPFQHQVWPFQHHCADTNRKVLHKHQGTSLLGGRFPLITSFLPSVHPRIILSIHRSLVSSHLSIHL